MIKAYATVTTLYEDAVDRCPFVIGVLTGVVIWAVFIR